MKEHVRACPYLLNPGDPPCVLYKCVYDGVGEIYNFMLYLVMRERSMERRSKEGGDGGM